MNLEQHAGLFRDRLAYVLFARLISSGIPLEYCEGFFLDRASYGEFYQSYMAEHFMSQYLSNPEKLDHLIESLGEEGEDW